MFSVEKKRLRGDLMIYSCLQGGCGELGVGLCSHEEKERT